MKYVLSSLALIIFYTSSAKAFETETMGGCISIPLPIPFKPIRRCCPDSPTRFKTTNIPFIRSTVSFPDKSVQTAALIQAWSRWNLGASNINFSTRGGTGNFNFNNRRNEVWITSNNALLADAPARADWRYNLATCSWGEADVIFGTKAKSFFWDFSENAKAQLGWDTSSTNRPFIASATHELGHAAGLRHENDIYNMMGSSYSHGNRDGDTLYFAGGESGNAGMVRLYGKGANRPDLGITQMKYIGIAQVQYSDHDFVGFSDSGGAALTPSGTGLGAQQQYTVMRGGKYQFEFTLENNGTEMSMKASVDLFLAASQNRNSADRKIASYSVTLGRSEPLTTRLAVILPSETPPGKYFLSARISNADGTDKEVTNRNNFAFIPIQVIANPDL